MLWWFMWSDQFFISQEIFLKVYILSLFSHVNPDVSKLLHPTAPLSFHNILDVPNLLITKKYNVYM